MTRISTTMMTHQLLKNIIEPKPGYLVMPDTKITGPDIREEFRRSRTGLDLVSEIKSTRALCIIWGRSNCGIGKKHLNR